MEIQSKLLGAMQERQIYRVGGEYGQGRYSSNRLRPPTGICRRRLRPVRFRQDLFTAERRGLHPPPLRERVEDVLCSTSISLSFYAQKLPRNICSLSQPARAMIQRYYWPGKFREWRTPSKAAVLLNTAR